MICDFHTSRLQVASSPIACLSSTLKGTVRYYAPEVHDEDDTKRPDLPTREIDVWAFGMVTYVSADPHL